MRSATHSAACGYACLVGGIGADDWDGWRRPSARCRIFILLAIEIAQGSRCLSLASVHAQHLAGDPAGIVRGEEQHGMGDVLGRAQALQRDRLDEALLPLLAIGLPLPLRRRIGADEAGRDIVDGDAPGAELMGELARQADLRRLGRGIGLDAGQADAEAGAAGDVDDAAATCRASCRAPPPATVEGAGHIDVEDGLPFRRRDLLQRPADLAEHAAGIVDQDIDWPASRSASATKASHLLGGRRHRRGRAAQVCAAQRAASPPAHRPVMSQAQTRAPRVARRPGRSRGRSLGRAGDDRPSAVEADVHEAAATGSVSAKRVQHCASASGRLPSSIVVDQREQPRGQRRADAVLAPRLDDRAELGIALGLAACARRDRARCRYGSWPSGGCRRPGRRRSDRPAAGDAPARRRAGSKPSKASSLTPSASATAATSRRQRDEDRAGSAAMAKQSAMESSVSAVANSSAP